MKNIEDHFDLMLLMKKVHHHNRRLIDESQEELDDVSIEIDNDKHFEIVNKKATINILSSYITD